MGRLDREVSPYLLAHADNPIDWFPWGQDAFDEAKRRDVPVFVSVGYHTCHWCHQMARESFSDPVVGALVNELMVSIKVDREEHPDVDQHLMVAAGAFTEHLGWPLTVFLTPEGLPFYAATYLPPIAREGIPSFTDVVTAVSEAWTSQREDVLSSARGLSESIAQALQTTPTAHPLETEHWEAVITHLESQEDRVHGGFGVAPKFPVAPVLLFLLSQEVTPSGREVARRALDLMAASALRDPVEGGFFRYGQRPDWSEPHYERMLYDNAGLLQAYAMAGRTDIAEGIFHFFRTVLRVPGGLASAQDSESLVNEVMTEGGYYLLDEVARRDASPPAVDRKVLTGWNGMALSALAQSARAGVGGDPLGLACEVADEVIAAHRVGPGHLVRLSRDGGVSTAAATLEDWGGLALGLLELGLVASRTDYLTVARELVDECVVAGDGMCVAPGGGDPLIRSLTGGLADVTEGAAPSGQAMIARAARILGSLTGRSSYLEAARRTVDPLQQTMLSRPLGFGGIALATWELSAPLTEVVVVSDSTDHPLRQVMPPGVGPRVLSVHVTRAQATELADLGFGLLENRAEPDGGAYVCSHGVCDLPAFDAGDLRAQLERRGLLGEAGASSLAQ